ncbi:MAG: 3-deoxy-D-manno-octulosonic acid transferase, partial [Rhodobacteraceae bacterium]|nr:3-deoxy-D-manno-octulosonic acid transferase [Paracoccaceae bacterium]
AFGAAVVHGPHLPQGLRRATDDLDAARAARTVAGAPELAAAIGDLLAPDTAAASAHAAWEVISARDAATERAARLLAEATAPGDARGAG